jgi:hypothetical protein
MDSPREDRSRSARFMAALIEDVLAARERLGSSDTQTARREVVRSSLAAIEGMTWIAREHVRLALAGMDELSPVTDLALREMAYGVTDDGRIVEQVRPLPILAAIRLFVTQAKAICPDLSVEFSKTGWSNLRLAVEVRNRITHPKPDQELRVSDADLKRVVSAVSWLTATVEYVMASTNLALVDFSNELREVVERLASGDAEALAEYREALRIAHAREEA